VDLRVACQKTQPMQDTGNGCQIVFTDVFDIAARRLLSERMPLDRAEGVRVNEARTVQLVIIGFGRMGRSLALRAAKMGHFANGTKLRIIVIDQHAHANEQKLLFRFPAIREVCDMDFRQMEAESAQARTLVAELCDPARFITSIALCMEDEVRATEIALQFHDIVDDHQVPLAVRYAHEEGLAAMLCGAEGRCSTLVRPFGLAGVDWSRDVLGGETDRWFANVIHEDFRANRLAEGRPETELALQPWDVLAENFRESNRQQADHIPVKIRAVGCEVVPVADPRPPVEFGDEETEVLSRMEHARWNAERLLDGWRYAPGGKDEKRKTHPSIVPWDELPEKIKDYDR
jgi:hypothetical protein